MIETSKIVGVCAVVIYLLSSFVMYDLNPANWPIWMRVACAVVVVVIMCAALDADKD